MSTLTLMFGIWVVFTTAFVALMIYRGHLTQYETDQLFLSTAPTHSQTEHDDILRRVKHIKPLCVAVGGAAGITTLIIVGMFLADAYAAVR